MNLLMITMLTVGSAIGQTPANGPVSGYEEYCDCQHCKMGISEHLRNHRAVHNTSPQTCYSPRFGCYHSNERYMNRYPAFHGTYYRKAYNYRNYFDYPWHAQPHEPTSLFSYNVGEDEPAPAANTNSSSTRAPAAAPMSPPAPPQARRAAPIEEPAKRSLSSTREIAPTSYLAPAAASQRVGSSAPAKKSPAATSTSSRRLSGSSETTR